MKKFLFVSCLILFTQLTFSQKYLAGVKMGYCTFSLSSVKSYQQQRLDHDILSEKAVTSFPNNYTYSANLEALINTKDYIGFSIAYFYTGGRNHIKDYSGEYKLDMLLSGYRLGLLYRNIQNKNSRINLYGQLQAGVVVSKIKERELLTISSSTYYQGGDTYKSNVPFFEPTVGVLLNFNKYILFDLGLGYELDFEEDFKGAKGPLANVGLDWSGFRFMLGIDVKF